VNMGNAKKKIGDYQGALYDFNEALKLDTTLTEIYNYRGEAYLITGSYELARDDFHRMVARYPSDGFALCGLGNVHLKLNELDQAREFFDRAITLYPDLGEAYHNRGLLLELKGDLEGACNDWHMAASLGIEASGEFLKECQKP